MSALIVQNLSLRNHSSKYISEYTLERNLMCVLSVGKHLLTDPI